MTKTSILNLGKPVPVAVPTSGPMPRYVVKPGLVRGYWCSDGWYTDVLSADWYQKWFPSFDEADADANEKNSSASM